MTLWAIANGAVFLGAALIAVGALWILVCEKEEKQ